MYFGRGEWQQAANDHNDDFAHPPRSTKRVLARVRQIQEPIGVLVLLVQLRHQHGRRREDVVDEDEDGLLGGEFDALTNDKHKLPDGQFSRHQVLLLVDLWNVRLFDALANHWNSVWVFQSNAVGFGAALLECVFGLEFRVHLVVGGGGACVFVWGKCQ